MTAGKPDRRIVLVWRLRLFVLAFVCAFLTSLFFTGNRLLWAGCTVSWVMAVLLLYFIYYPIKYNRLRYRLENDWLVINCGVIYNRIKAIPVRNIQYVTISALPLPHMFGLSTLLVHAAGGLLFVPGLRTEEAIALRRLLAQLTEGEGGF